MNDGKTLVEHVDGNLVMTRTFDAPRELVFAAWTEAERVQSWWGCAQTRAVESSVDLRVGGAYKHVMQIEGAGECVIVGEFTEVEPPNKIAYKVAGGPSPGDMPDFPETTTTIELFDRDGQTELRMTITGLANTPFDEIVQGGWQASLSKLDGHVLAAA